VEIVQSDRRRMVDVQIELGTVTNIPYINDQHFECTIRRG
jgi:hypothetical protein